MKNFIGSTSFLVMSAILLTGTGLLATISMVGTALAVGGCDDLLGDMQCAGGEGSKGGGGGGLFKCT